MTPDKSRQTVFVRATAEQRQEMRWRALSVPCGYCYAKEGHGCVGIGGKASKPHSQRIVAGERFVAQYCDPVMRYIG